MSTWIGIPFLSAFLFVMGGVLVGHLLWYRDRTRDLDAVKQAESKYSKAKAAARDRKHQFVELSREVNSFEQQRDELRKENESLQKTLASEKEHAHTLQTEIGKLQSEHGRFEMACSDAKEQRDEAINQATKLLDEIEQLRAELDTAEERHQASSERMRELANAAELAGTEIAKRQSMNDQLGQSNQDLHAQIAKLQDDIADLEEQLRSKDGVESEVSELQRQIVELQSKRDQIQTDHDQLQEQLREQEDVDLEVSGLKSQIVDLQSKQHQIQTERDGLIQQRDDLIQQRDDAAREYSQATSRQEQLAAEIDEMKERCDDLTILRDEAIQQRDHAIEQRDQFASERALEKTNAENQFEEADEKYTRLQNEYSTLRDQYETAIEDVAKQKAAMQRRQSEINELNESLQASTIEVQTLQSGHDELLEQLDERTSRIQEAIDGRVSAETALAQLESQMEQIQLELEQSSKLKTKHEQTLVQINQSTDAMRAKARELTAELEAKHSQNQTLEAKISDQNNAIERHRGEIKRLQAFRPEFEKLRTTAAEQTELIGRLRRELQNATNQLESAKQFQPQAESMRKQAAGLQKQAEAMQTRAEDLRAQLQRVSTELEASLDANASMQDRIRQLENQLHENAVAMRDLRRKRANVPNLTINQERKAA